MTTALIIVDLQYDFIEGGNLAVVGGIDVARKTVDLIDKNMYGVIALTRDWHIDPGDHFSKTPDYIDTWPAHCVAGTDGAALIRDIGAALSRFPLNKNIEVFSKGQHSASYSGFDGVSEDAGVAMDLWLRAYGVDAVDIVGLAYGHCVFATAESAVQLGYTTRVLRQYTASVDPTRDEFVTDLLTARGVEVVA